MIVRIALMKITIFNVGMRLYIGSEGNMTAVSFSKTFSISTDYFLTPVYESVYTIDIPMIRRTPISFFYYQIGKYYNSS